MSSLRLTLACGPYDRTRALANGSVQPSGIELSYVALEPHELFRRQIASNEFDIAEMSLSFLVMLVASGRRDLVGIPAFPSRQFRHNAIFINSQAGINAPRDLIGRKVGVPGYQITAAVYVRGLLQHQYGVHPTQIRWYSGGLNTPDSMQRPAFKKPEELEITEIGPEKTLNDMLIRGEIDALVSPAAPRAWLTQHPNVRRLFPDFKQVEREYYRETGIFPIMHTLVLRGDVYERHPWAARAVYDAFCEAKQQCMDALEDVSALKATLVWLQAEMEEERALLGHDYWPYGLSANRKTLAAFTSYVYDQGLSGRQIEPDELFVTELRGT